MEYTPSQKEALERFDDFLKGENQVFILRGAAGTGKTTIMKEMINRLKEHYKTTGVISKTGDFSDLITLMAPTGRASHILHSKTQFPAFTIHKAIYHRTGITESSLHPNDEDEEKGDVRFHFELSQVLHNPKNFYFLDEASLVSNAFSENEAFVFGSGYLLDDLMKFIRNNKIVFVGDHAQLPPVGMNSSPALDKEYLKSHYGVDCEEATLIDVVRQHNISPILNNAEVLRRSIDCKTFNSFRLKDGEDFYSSTSIISSYMENTKENLKSNIIITFKNSDARDYNVEIRKRLYGENVPRLIQGDFLVVSRNNYIRGVIYNGTIVRVKNCNDDACIITRMIKVSQKTKDGSKSEKKEIELRFRPITIQTPEDFITDKPGSPYLLLDNFLDTNEAQLDRNLASALYLDFKFRHPKLKPGTQDFKEALMHDEYFNALICKYGYAITCHKAQGGEWENVFVDMTRLGRRNNEDYFRWAYTAITRSNKRLWHYNSPDFDAFSEINILPILKGGQLVYPQNGNTDFKRSKFNAVKEKASMDGIASEEDLSASWQHRIIFSDCQGNKVRFVLWYNGKGYSNKPIMVDQSTSYEFENKCREYLEAEPNVQFEFMDESKVGKMLFDTLNKLTRELGIQIVNIQSFPWHYTYHLLTDGQAVVEFWYNAKDQISSMKPLSNLGSDDELLKKLCENF